MAIRKVSKEPAVAEAMPKLENFKLLKLSRVDKAPWNYKENEADKAKALTEAIRRSGQIVNINVRRKDDGRYEVLDGNHRLDSLQALGYVKVLAYDHGEISVTVAQRIAIELNEHRFGTNEKRFKGLLEGLQEEFGVADLALTIPPGLLIQETRFREDFDYDELPPPDVAGDDTRYGRFILVYQNEVEMQLFQEMLGIEGDKVVRDINDFPLLKEIAETEI